MKNKKRVLALMLAGVLTLGCFPTTVGAVNNAYDGTKPADGTTKKQPFLAGTGGSTNFRIPGLVTLNDGTLVASSDARWNGGGDGGGLDTIVSRSTDNGKTWSYTFANYLGDNGNVHNNGSTAFIDPALTTDGGTVYMAADLYPAGTALNSASYAPKTGHTGYDSQHRLVLAKATDSVTAASDTAQRMNAAFTYYLEKNPDENATSYYLLKDASGNTVSGYTVDAYFNITGNGESVLWRFSVLPVSDRFYLCDKIYRRRRDLVRADTSGCKESIRAESAGRTGTRNCDLYGRT